MTCTAPGANLPLCPTAHHLHPTRNGAIKLRDLVEETFDLIEIHLPEVDVDILRPTFRAERVPQEVPSRPTE